MFQKNTENLNNYIYITHLTAPKTHRHHFYTSEFNDDNFNVSFSSFVVTLTGSESLFIHNKPVSLSTASLCIRSRTLGMRISRQTDISVVRSPGPATLQTLAIVRRPASSATFSTVAVVVVVVVAEANCIIMADRVQGDEVATRVLLASLRASLQQQQQQQWAT